MDKRFEETVKDQIIRYFALNGNDNIPNLASQLGYSVPTTTKYLRILLDEKIVREFGKISSSKGRNPIEYGVIPECMFFVGVDVGHFKTKVSIMNIVGEIIFDKNITYDSFENTPAMLEELCDNINSILKESGIKRDKINTICFALSGRVDSSSGYSHSIFHFEGDEIPLSDILSEKLGKHTIIDNDTRAMTFGEASIGAAKNFKNALYINLSWGIALGIILDGRIYSGSNGFAGELGHTNVYKNEIMCHCGKKGCLETEISGSALHRKLIERIRNGESSILSQKVQKNQNISSQDIIQAAINEDTLCIDLIEKMGQELGHQLANLINIFNPETVILGGTYSEAYEYLFLPIQTAMKKYSLKLLIKDLKLQQSILHEDAGSIGACLLARQKGLGWEE